MASPGYGNYSKEESITMFLKALRDPSNDNILNSIRKALKKLGLTEREIQYYEATGRREEEWSHFEDEMNEIDREFHNTFDTLETSARVAKKRVSSIFLMGILGAVFAGGILISILIFSSANDSRSSDKTPSAITESSSMQDGDKL